MTWLDYLWHNPTTQQLAVHKAAAADWTGSTSTRGCFRLQRQFGAGKRVQGLERKEKRGEERAHLGSAHAQLLRCTQLADGRALLCSHTHTRGRFTWQLWRCVCSTTLHLALGHEEGRAGQL